MLREFYAFNGIFFDNMGVLRMLSRRFVFCVPPPRRRRYRTSFPVLYAIIRVVGVVAMMNGLVVCFFWVGAVSDLHKFR